jgi:phosphoribosyl-AMP cyclohydrolase
MQEPSLLEALTFDGAGLIPAIAVDHASDSVLMVAWMNRSAVTQTVDTGIAHYFSRSRQKLWKKGESSGHTQEVISIHLDCDGDVLLLRVKQTGGIACHTGRVSCFYRQLLDGRWTETEPPIKDPAEIYPNE